MELSRYLKVYACPETPGHRLLFSTCRGSLLRVGEETYQRIVQHTTSAKTTALLSRLGILTASRGEEMQVVNSLVDRANAASRTLRVTIVLNLDCNFNCRYCYESRLRGHYYLSDRTTGQLIRFIRQRLSPAKPNLVIDFYGGEPLLSLPRIEQISLAMRKLAARAGGRYAFTLVTNGSLFTRPVARRLAKLGLKSVKITLDGPAAIHNRNRPFKSGAGSFDAIVGNIARTCDLVAMVIGGNFEKNTYQRFAGLLDHLNSMGLTPEKIPLVKFDPVIESRIPSPSTPCFADRCASMPAPWLIDAETRLRAAILSRGYRTTKPSPQVCMIETHDSYVVNYDGHLYKCPAFIGMPDFSVGHVAGGVTDYARLYRLEAWKDHPACVACEYLPLCFGGCRYLSLVATGSIATLDCRRAYLDASLETIIQQEARFRYAKDALAAPALIP